MLAACFVLWCAPQAISMRTSAEWQNNPSLDCRFAPPLVITEAQLMECADIIQDTILQLDAAAAA